jgi:hypothetical protein
VTTERFKNPEGGADDNDDRPTVAPPFDPAEFAREANAAKSGPPNRRTPEYGLRHPLATLTDEMELESARQKSKTDTCPPPTKEMSESRRSSLLSLADSRASIPVSERREPSKPSKPPPLPKEARKGGKTQPPPVPAGRRSISQKPTPPTGSASAGDTVPESKDRETLTAKDWEELTLEELPLSLKLDDPLSDELPKIDPHRVEPPKGDAARVELKIKEADSRDPSRGHLAAKMPPSGRTTMKGVKAPTGDVIDLRIGEMRDQFSLGDYTGALASAEAVLELDPKHAAAAECADNCRTVLRQMYTARIGPMDRVPIVTVARDQLRWLSIDHRAGFVLSHIDGVSSLEMILDVSGMPLLDALRILCELAQQRIISFR